MTRLTPEREAQLLAAMRANGAAPIPAKVLNLCRDLKCCPNTLYRLARRHHIYPTPIHSKGIIPYRRPLYPKSNNPAARPVSGPTIFPAGQTHGEP